MITLQTQLHLDGIRGNEVTDFLLACTDQAYQLWWPGTHLKFHTLERHPNNLGNVVYMDEFVGKRRIKMTGLVTEALSGKKIIWQFKKVFRLPAWLTVELVDDGTGVTLTHTIQAGFKGLGELLNPILRLYFTKEFEQAMDEHAKTEFPKLRDLLRRSEQSLRMAT